MTPRINLQAVFVEAIDREGRLSDIRVVKIPQLLAVVTLVNDACKCMNSARMIL